MRSLVSHEEGDAGGQGTRPAVKGMVVTESKTLKNAFVF